MMKFEHIFVFLDMYIEKLKIKNFRNLENLDVILNKNVNIFIGNNAQGKTNILESIYVLALTKSERNINDYDLIKNGEEFYKINGKIKKGRNINDYEVLLKKEEKILKINNKIEKKVSNYISDFNVIMFSPEDLDIIKKSPNVRRNLINIELCQLFRNYINILNQYNKILKMRNDYLRKNYLKIDDIYFDILTDVLIDRGIKIINYRQAFINDINQNINKIYLKIAKKGNLEIIYNKNLEFTTKEELRKFYYKNRENEINQKSTLYGPHRDDINFMLDKEDLKNFGSQGQQRIAILAFKLSEIDIFKKITGYNPIILLDDIFSELDIEKRKNLLKFIKYDIQFIITTTDINNMSQKVVDKATIYKIKEGKIIS